MKQNKIFQDNLFSNRRDHRLIRAKMSIKMKLETQKNRQRTCKEKQK